MEQLDQFCEWIKPLARKDSVDFDFYGFKREKTEVLFQNGKLKNRLQSEMKHLNLRVLRGEKSGFSYTKDFCRESLKECYYMAVNGLNLSDKKEGGKLSEDTEFEDGSRFYDKSYKKTSIEEKINKARDMDASCFDFDQRVRPVYSSVSDRDHLCFFGNSKGTCSFYRSNDVSANSYSLAVESESRSNGYSESVQKNYQDIDFKKIGSKAASQALKKLNYSIPETKRYPVVFQSGEAVGRLLPHLTDMLSGKAIFDGFSPLKDSFKKKIFSDQFSLYDDPFALWGTRNKIFDGEGFAMKKTNLVKKGVLENYLTSSFFAKALQVPHTRRADWIGEKASLGVSVTNLVMEQGESAFKELVNEFPKTIVIDNLKGFAGYNPVSGDFSIESEGFFWESGEEVKPLCQFTVSGNVKDLFLNIFKVGNDSKMYGGTVKAPSFLVPDLMIAGK